MAYPAVASFDKDTSNIQFSQTLLDNGMHDVKIELFDVDEKYIFDSENDRLMNLLIPEQFKVRINDGYYVPESVDYYPTGHVVLHVLSPTGDIRSVAVHINMLYFENDSVPWTVPDSIKEAYCE
ncbi:unknown protein [Spodoptera frugiperda multiple nucleopolyhedrovirus]|uniref:Sf42 n=1 Tax=Spodoptera frugiperda nuclear polyhedrosis virus TaxID=10455 RepID=A1YJ32_NPVSF|nr:hypothetical protein SFMNPV_gp042 [Spodoptera frugiperda multiple nucleopolyhedrovirus]ABM45752.1 unknown protein [Spodoptera frugiperda multiple nucleopolyhedrovirus]ADV91274.1 hypothetical protein Sf42 [Spodoptera frugiperda multiple nucleopolyhedrovirus]AFH58993.1 hypothetical protein Sf42 [Spodoptera frugiperda multiple nucleopolyhedrovirus]AIW01453.1 hypothetical protein [Spodoptera frugiperda multiple nucleopolyhedrovirus]QED39955.1 hypothetical protein [Spodoptera frugiperda multiple